MSTEFSEDQMLAELTVVFPTLWKRRLTEFGGCYASQAGIWTGGSTACMPDGDPVFFSLADGQPPYRNGPVHEGFEQWLANRGWSWENYDGETILLLPESSFTELEEATV